MCIYIYIYIFIHIDEKSGCEAQELAAADEALGLGDEAEHLYINNMCIYIYRYI